jgi:hypothetical protein
VPPTPCGRRSDILLGEERPGWGQAHAAVAARAEGDASGQTAVVPPRGWVSRMRRATSTPLAAVIAATTTIAVAIE